MEALYPDSGMGSMLLRWLHVTTAIAWIGSSFMFMHLDASLRKQKNMQPASMSWQVHGGGFYEMSKYTLAPAVMPDHLDLAQTAVTWISGFSLSCWVYYGQSTFFLIDPRPCCRRPERRSLALSRWRSAGSSMSCSLRSCHLWLWRWSAMSC